MQFVVIPRLAQVTPHSPAVDGVDGRREIGVRRHQHAHRLRVLGAGPLEELEARGAGHALIGHQYAYLVLLHQHARFVGTGRHEHRESIGARRFEHGPILRFIVDEENVATHCAASMRGAIRVAGGRLSVGLRGSRRRNRVPRPS